MIILKNAHNHWDQADFSRHFKAEVQALDKHLLPLHKALCYSSNVSDEAVSVVILKCTENTQHFMVDACVFFSGIIAGCSCADDPTPQDLQNEACELRFYIDRATAETSIELRQLD